MASIIIRVNPGDHEDFVTEEDELFRHPHTQDWPVFELEIPKPKRQYRCGDLVYDKNNDAAWIRTNDDRWIPFFRAGAANILSLTTELDDHNVREDWYNRYRMMGNAWTAVTS